ncbi:ribonuclease H protein [Artemisia annua]|uniref:Ribonuclease H protein n=1 Tax=Artemisia annua TaxID=35608 RepID=A0A2U1QH81_ARTAN|nr:ribonuclease H protein [Artemisia annua]
MLFLCVKLYFDATVQPPRCASYAIPPLRPQNTCYSNANRQSLFGLARTQCCSESVLAAELCAIRSACILAATNGWNNAFIESDSRSAISLASTEDVPPRALAALICDIKFWKSQMNLHLCWTSRACNLAAHHVAKVAYVSDANFIWVDNFPCEITSIARRDAL